MTLIESTRASVLIADFGFIFAFPGVTIVAYDFSVYNIENTYQ